MELSKLYEGWRNDIFPPAHLKDLIRAVQAERTSICVGCENYRTDIPGAPHCASCGCFISKKTACLSCHCPINKWQAVLNKEEETEIKNRIDESTASEEENDL